jgi:hypothetical protein
MNDGRRNAERTLKIDGNRPNVPRRVDQRATAHAAITNGWCKVESTTRWTGLSGA